MICQNCQQRLANVHFTQIINGQKIEKYLCEECARDKGQVDFASPFGLSDLFTGLLGGYPGGLIAKTAVPQQLTCPGCGMTFEQFRDIGKMGCADCYSTFADRLNPVVRHLHGNVKHSGKIPGSAAGTAENSKASGILKIISHSKNSAGPKDEPVSKNAAASKNTVVSKNAAVSKTVEKSSEIEALRTQLEAAIKEEKYEKAAELRDKIRNLESQPKK